MFIPEASQSFPVSRRYVSHIDKLRRQGAGMEINFDVCFFFLPFRSAGRPALILVGESSEGNEIQGHISLAPRSGFGFD